MDLPCFIMPIEIDFFLTDWGPIVWSGLVWSHENINWRPHHKTQWFWTRISDLYKHMPLHSSILILMLISRALSIFLFLVSGFCSLNRFHSKFKSTAWVEFDNVQAVHIFTEPFFNWNSSRNSNSNSNFHAQCHRSLTKTNTQLIRTYYTLHIVHYHIHLNRSLTLASTIPNNKHIALVFSANQLET